MASTLDTLPTPQESRHMQADDPMVLDTEVNGYVAVPSTAAYGRVIDCSSDRPNGHVASSDSAPAVGSTKVDSTPAYSAPAESAPIEPAHSKSIAPEATADVARSENGDSSVLESKAAKLSSVTAGQPAGDVDVVLTDAPSPAAAPSPGPAVVQKPDIPPTLSHSPIHDESISKIPNTEAAPPSDAPEPMDVTVNTPAPQPAVHPVEAPATLGHVRQRDDDMDDEPVYKRARVDQSEDMAPPAPATQAAAPAAEPAPAPPKADWDSKPMTKAQHKYLLESVRKAKKIKVAIPFLNPVDPVALKIPKYPEIIKNPMDIGTMEEKLKVEKYATANDFWADFETMVQNSVTFNGPQHAVSASGMSLKSYFAKLMSSLPKGDVLLEAPKPKKVEAPPRIPPRRESRSAAKPAPAPTPAAAPKVPKEEHKPFLDPNGMPIIRRDSTTDRPKRDIVKPVRDLPYVNPKPKKKKTLVELRFCEWVTKEIFLRKHSAYAYPFTVPVDPVALNIPSYHRVIKKPMDFGTIKDNLKNGSYASAKEYHADAKLVFANCYRFNTAEEDVTRMGHQLEAVFDDLWTNKDQWIADNAPPSEPASEQEDDDDEDSEDEEDGDQLRRMQEIQQQIAALSAEALRLTTTTTTKLPKPVKKKSKSSGGSHKPKRSSSGLSGKSKAPKKKKSHRKLTLAQKRYVSEGISALDEPTMRQAVQMIRNGVPSLRVCTPSIC
jgi:bromodomain-containing factor 1